MKKERGDVAAMLKEQEGATPGSTSSIKSEPPAIKEEPHENGTELGSFDDKKVATPLIDSKDNSKFPLYRVPTFREKLESSEFFLIRKN